MMAFLRTFASSVSESRRMNIPQIEIPPDLPDEARALVEEVNTLLAEVTKEIAAMNNAPLGFSAEHRQQVLERAEQTLQRFIEMREQLRGYGLGWSEEWPELIES
jgi:hypothetical protein